MCCPAYCIGKIGTPLPALEKCEKCMLADGIKCSNTTFNIRQNNVIIITGYIYIYYNTLGMSIILTDYT